MNNLSHYLKDHGLSQSAFARRVGVTQGSLSKLCAGVIRPSLNTALAIERETDGAVPIESWPGFEALASRGAHVPSSRVAV